jgi:hypothetical protein
MAVKNRTDKFYKIIHKKGKSIHKIGKYKQMLICHNKIRKYKLF